MQLVLAVILVRLLIMLLTKENDKEPVVKNKRKRKGGFMFRKIFGRRISDARAIFRDHYAEIKAVYAMYFDKIPCVTFIGETDATKALAYIREKYDYAVTEFLQHAYYDHDEGKMFFNNTILILPGERIIEVGSNYCQILHRADHYEWAMKLINELAAFRNVPEATAAPATVVGFARQTTLN